jgi:hypothetical protein
MDDHSLDTSLEKDDGGHVDELAKVPPVVCRSAGIRA